VLSALAIRSLPMKIKNVSVVLALVSLASLAGCAADGAEEAGTSSETAELRAGVQGLHLPNGASEVDDSRPETLRVVVPAANAKATVTDAYLANCTVTVDPALSNRTRTVFDLTLEYEIDDGWNGCTFEFSARGYKSTLEAGFFVDD
jgi:hypothetical protein